MVTQGLRKQVSSSVHLPPGETQCSFSFLLPLIQNALSEIWSALCTPTRVGSNTPQLHAQFKLGGVSSGCNSILPSHPSAIKPIQQYKRSFPKQVVSKCSTFQPIVKQGQKAFPGTQGQPLPLAVSSQHYNSKTKIGASNGDGHV